MNYVVGEGKEMIFYVRYYDLMKKILLLMRKEASRDEIYENCLRLDSMNGDGIFSLKLKR